MIYFMCAFLVKFAIKTSPFNAFVWTVSMGGDVVDTISAIEVSVGVYTSSYTLISHTSVQTYLITFSECIYKKMFIINYCLKVFVL